MVKFQIFYVPIPSQREQVSTGTFFKAGLIFIANLAIVKKLNSFRYFSF